LRRIEFRLRWYRNTSREERSAAWAETADARAFLLPGTPNDTRGGTRLFTSGQRHWPHPRPQARKGPVTRTMSKRLYVGNLSFNTTEADLEAAFSQWGGSN